MTAAKIANGVLAALARGISYDGEPVDRAWVLETLERAWEISGAQFDNLIRDVLQDLDPMLDEAAIERLVSMREPVRLALLRRLRS